MIFVLTKRVTHAFLKKPIIQSVEIEASSFNDALKKLTIYNKYISDLKHYGKASWIDHKESEITITLEEKKNVDPINDNSTVRASSAKRNPRSTETNDSNT